ncbi:MAG: hypothetical protein CVT88_04315 [Candidatus Altiarchaeales archaeon HGW-Altiarchaeales-1]|nr:MAG: hypothetical protein CVT89_04480 [Candidatus Altiarchaeales archaeon HGW-Altiarchaeales-2]PKP59904.1 MAG: hypothetical protein CVT88_04315 [Candidatus Altiarchaeales archaeon HGW-Altiarchaeales-1]
MPLLSKIELCWFSDDELLKENPRALVELFLDTLGASKGTASDIFEILLLNKRKGIHLKSDEIRNEVIEMRKKRKELGEFDGEIEESLSGRNVQIWLKFFKDMKMVECINDRYFFSGDKFPSEAFEIYVKPLIIDESVRFIGRLLKKIEENYGLKKD